MTDSNFDLDRPCLTPNYYVSVWNARRYTLDGARVALRDMSPDIFDRMCSLIEGTEKQQRSTRDIALVSVLCYFVRPKAPRVPAPPAHILSRSTFSICSYSNRVLYLGTY